MNPEPRPDHWTLTSTSRIWVAGHTGLAGSAIVRRLRAEGCTSLLTPTHADLDLRDPAATRTWVTTHHPEFVFLAAGTVGGIHANSTRPVDFLHDNLMIAASVMSACAAVNVGRLLFLGSSCIYPRDCPQPIREEYLLTGPLETTNEAYALAKIAGLKLVQAHRRQYGRSWISAMPTNLYGPGDTYDLLDAHVLPALIRKFHEAGPGGTVSIWGSGRPRREFLHVDDLADALVFLMKTYDGDIPLNVGTGEDLTIRELAELIRRIVQPAAQIEWDGSKPDGTPRKLLDVTRLHALGWRHRVELEEGIRATYAAYRSEL